VLTTCGGAPKCGSLNLAAVQNQSSLAMTAADLLQVGAADVGVNWRLDGSWWWLAQRSRARQNH
jgi:hypothetical protein